MPFMDFVKQQHCYTSGEGQDYLFTYGNKIAYFAIEIATVISGTKVTYKEGLTIKSDWEEYIAKQVIINIV